MKYDNFVEVYNNQGNTLAMAKNVCKTCDNDSKSWEMNLVGFHFHINIYTTDGRTIHCILYEASSRVMAPQHSYLNISVPINNIYL